MSYVGQKKTAVEETSLDSSAVCGELPVFGKVPRDTPSIPRHLQQAELLSQGSLETPSVHLQHQDVPHDVQLH